MAATALATQDAGASVTMVLGGINGYLASQKQHITK